MDLVILSSNVALAICTSSCCPACYRCRSEQDAYDTHTKEKPASSCKLCKLVETVDKYCIPTDEHVQKTCDSDGNDGIAI